MSIRVVVTYHGFSPEKDKKIFSIAKDVVGESFCFGGYNYIYRIRDNNWNLESESDAKTLKELLLQSNIEGLNVEIINGSTKLSGKKTNE
jgi:hypothetical protein